MLNRNSKQYIQLLEERLNEVEKRLQPSPAHSESLIRDSVETGDIDVTGKIQTFPLERPREITNPVIQAQHQISTVERTVFIPLPPKEYLAHFVSSALEDICQVWPLFNIGKILQLVDDQNLAGRSNCNDNPTRWATLNALVGMAFHWKADNKAIAELFPSSWVYFKNSYAIFPELAIKDSSLESCRAILAMALYMQGTADARAFTSLLSAATHASQCIGLHLEDTHGSSEPCDMVERRQTFWLIRVLQCNASIKFGLPAPSDDVDIENLCHDPEIGASTEPSLLRYMSTMSLIQSRLCRCLRPGSMLWKDLDGISRTLVELDNDLESWLLKLPPEVRRVSLPRTINPGTVQLHFIYYASTWKIYAASNRLHELRGLSAASIQRESPSPLLASPSPTDGARATISLIQKLSPQPLAFLW